MRQAAAIALTVVALLPSAGRGTAQDDEPLGTGAGLRLAEPPQLVRVPAGARMRRHPDPLAATEMVLGEELELPLLERRGGWVRVRLGELKLWTRPVAAEGEPAAAAAAASAAPAARSPGPDPARLERARRILGQAAVTGRLGSCELISDVDRPRLLELFRTVAGTLPEAYQQRYGVAVEAPHGAVVLFAEAAAFEAYGAEDPAIQALGAPAHAGGGVVVMHVGRREPREAAPILIHELTHLLNRQVLGELPPAWLEEGIASDLAMAKIDRRGRLDPRALGGTSLLTIGPATGPPGARRVRRSLYLTGARAALNRLLQARARRRIEPLAELVELPWQVFVQPAGRELRYIQSAFFVRYLLDGEGGRRAPALRAHLAARAAGEREDTEGLRRRLGAGWQELEEGFFRWLRGIRL